MKYKFIIICIILGFMVSGCGNSKEINAENKAIELFGICWESYQKNGFNEKIEYKEIENIYKQYPDNDVIRNLYHFCTSVDYFWVSNVMDDVEKRNLGREEAAKIDEDYSGAYAKELKEYVKSILDGNETIKYPYKYIGIYDTEIKKGIFIGQSKEELHKHFSPEIVFSKESAYYSVDNGLRQISFSIEYDDKHIIKKIFCNTAGLNKLSFPDGSDLFLKKIEFESKFKNVVNFEGDGFDDGLHYMGIYISETNNVLNVITTEDIKNIKEQNYDKIYRIIIGCSLSNDDEIIEYWEFENITESKTTEGAVL